MGVMTLDDKVRIDKWLWAARFFKTRSLAAKAVSGGHVHVNSQRIKPSRSLQVGDELRIRRGLTEFVVIVLELSRRRGPATVARTLYQETEDSILQRESNMEKRRRERMAQPAPGRKPDKRDRRKIRKFIRKD
jgi:ribosome-associated heat shock protein Hsp15